MFKKIAIPDPNPTLKMYGKRLQPFSSEPIIFYDETPKNRGDFILRCSKADAVLIGWTSKLPREVLEKCVDLQYIGLACTLFEGEGANVNLAYARDRGITVTGVRDYGDIGVAEYVLSEIIRHIQYTHPRKELSGTKVGVIGAGGAGAPTALALKKMGAQVSYFSRTHKSRMEAAGIRRFDLTDLLEDSEIISLHMPRNIRLLDAGLLGRFSGKLILNTSLGLPVDEEAMKHWLEDQEHTLSTDAGAIGPFLELKDQYPNIRYLPYQSGFTSEAQIRLVDTVVENMRRYLEE